MLQWVEDAKVSAWIAEPGNKAAMAHEMADVFGYLLRLADLVGTDLEAALREKIEINGRKYPVELSRGNATKYTEADRESKVRIVLRPGLMDGSYKN